MPPATEIAAEWCPYPFHNSIGVLVLLCTTSRSEAPRTWDGPLPRLVIRRPSGALLVLGRGLMITGISSWAISVRLDNSRATASIRGQAVTTNLLAPSTHSRASSSAFFINHCALMLSPKVSVALCPDQPLSSHCCRCLRRSACAIMRLPCKNATQGRPQLQTPMVAPTLRRLPNPPTRGNHGNRAAARTGGWCSESIAATSSRVRRSWVWLPGRQRWPSSTRYPVPRVPEEL